MTHPFAPALTPLCPPWLVRWAEQVWAQLRVRRPAAGAVSMADPDLEVLEQLSLHTLRDIGAPDWVQSRAQARRATSLEPLHRLRDGSHPVDAGRW